MNGIIIRDKMFNTQSVRSRGDAENYVPGEASTTKSGIQRLHGSSLSSGMYLDNLEADYIYSNVSDITNLYSNADNCNLELDPADYLNISVPKISCGNLTADVVNGPVLTVEKSLNIDPLLVIDELTVKNLTVTNMTCTFMNSTNATSLKDYNISTLTTTNQANMTRLESPYYIETSELFESKNITGATSTLNKNELGCKYWSSGQLSGTRCNLTDSVFDADKSDFSSPVVEFQNA